jgi:putative flippase GtrA
MDYLTATVWSFFIANTLNYFTNRVWGFRDTPTKIARSYISYLSFAALALFAIVGLMFIFVELLGIQYFLARIVIGIIIGIANYITNHIFTFKIPFV